MSKDTHWKDHRAECEKDLLQRMCKVCGTVEEVGLFKETHEVSAKKFKKSDLHEKKRKVASAIQSEKQKVDRHDNSESDKWDNDPQDNLTQKCLIGKVPMTTSPWIMGRYQIVSLTNVMMMIKGKQMVMKH